MALIDNTTWTGKDTEGFYSTALIKGATKEKIRLISDVKSKVKLASLNLTGIIQAGACEFNDHGTTTLAQKTLTVCDLMVNISLCPKDFEVNYLSMKQRAGSNNSDIPATFVDYFTNEIALNIQASLETTIWQGNQSTSPVVGVCDGFLKAFDADSDVIDVTGTTLTAANIIAEIAKVYAAIPDTIIDSPNLVIFMSTKAAKFYKQAQAAVATGSGTYFIGDKELDYLGIPIIATSGMPANVMVAADSQNLWYGTDLVSDENEIKMIDMSDTTADKLVRFRTDFKFGVQYGNGVEIVYYH